MVIFRILCGKWIEFLWWIMKVIFFVVICFILFVFVIGNFVIFNFFFVLLLNLFSVDSDEELEDEEEKKRKEEEKKRKKKEKEKKRWLDIFCMFGRNKSFFGS